MLAKSQEDIHRIYDSIQSVKRLSDGVIKLGPINVIGIDGVLALLPIPLLSAAYSVIAGGIILIQGARARVSPGTWLTALVILLIDSGITSVEEVSNLVPVAGPFLKLIVGGGDALFQGHLYAAHIIQKDIDKTLYVNGSAYGARQSGDHASNMSDMRATKGKNRLVYLG